MRILYYHAFINLLSIILRICDCPMENAPHELRSTHMDWLQNKIQIYLRSLCSYHRSPRSFWRHHPCQLFRETASGVLTEVQHQANSPSWFYVTVLKLKSRYHYHFVLIDYYSAACRAAIASFPLTPLKSPLILWGVFKFHSFQSTRVRTRCVLVFHYSLCSRYLPFTCTGPFGMAYPSYKG